ncbi:hypothetical protein Alches_08070 [Alicyclobacillus hesperidum subsp. aegles]|uniref:Uncharacterized protein n=1 Tax=Alicyclobacillus hesperidum TaxID=89784 RepID=A0A1H2WSF8_9BACL|nr:hypothetical protein [Alicyclobacillus hesperidum]KRW91455.1 hypothetical protein SD51_08930 [Alicyclobacillus tengchongensis]GLG00768.1 hypothetical protein Alches_08070 [Alicyclobacillus hesperidum subsp. aegles]GLV12569.1 hypothetical protein Heshes_02530 [Alicyclobacillus hesperidum]SDW83572.1 hypothetical protein SAMN04489725_11671 [Alicyclobacillus hesperidum]
MSRVRLLPIFVVAVVVLAILFGGWQAYQHYNLLNPLKRSLQSVAGVQTVDISTGSPDIVQVQLGPFQKLKNGDLQETYHDISNEIENRLGSNVTVRLTDGREGSLTQIFESSFEFYIQEGIAKENYTQMVSQVNQLAAKDGIEARITMDNQYIYVQLAKGNHYLYRVIPYTIHQGGASS